MMARLRLIRIAGLFVAALVATTGQAFAASPPTVTGISPNSGNVSGGNTVTITGTNFTGVTSVTIGGNTATNVVLGGLPGCLLAPSGTCLTATVPAATSTSFPAPTVTASSSNPNPNHGGTGGGTTIQISGTNFLGSANVVVTTPAGNSGTTGNGLYTYTGVVNGVSIGGTSATNVTVFSTSLIQATTPPGIPGVADVLVTTAVGTNSGSTGNKLYTYADGGPSISTVNPQIGLTGGGNSITIMGGNFVPGTKFDGTTATTVTIGGNAATSVMVTSTISLTAVVPAGTAGVQQVVVSTVAGQATSSYQYVAPANPVISTISPNIGSTAGGTQVTITGAHFTGATSVTFGNTPAGTFQVNNDGQITTVTPANSPGKVDVTVTVVVPNGGGTFTGTSTSDPGRFTFVTPTPLVTAISPNRGSTSGGTSVTIVGQYFTGATSVTIGGNALSPFTVVSDTQINGTTSAGTAGTADVVVTTPSGNSGTSGQGLYTYGTPAPTVTSISPNGGSIAGGTNVTITGSFTTGASVTSTAVTFGGFAATNVVLTNATTITATTPAHAAGTVDVVVTQVVTGTGGGTLSGTGSNLFTYGASPPTVTSISPASGSTLGGTLVTITGSNFSGTPQVTINGVAAGQVTLRSSTQLTAVTPAGTGTNVPVIVTTSFGASAPANIYSYVAPPPPSTTAPTVTSISPSSGSTAGGTHVTITGTNFTGATSVTIGGNTATGVTVVNATTITATTPPGTAGPPAVDVVVKTPGGTGTGSGLYTYVAPLPTVTAISPNSGTTLGGTSVTITGSNFTGATSVTIGSTAVTSFTVLTATTITAKTAAHAAGPVSVVVMTPAGSSTGGPNYTYVTPAGPTVTAISPNNGTTAGGTSVTITGTNFTGATGVTIGGTAASFVTVVSATSITATTVAHAAGTVNVVVTTPAGSGTGTNLFTYFVMPTVTSVSPSSGPTAGGTSVIITGTGFTGATKVSFGGTLATTFTVNSPTSITATAPTGSGTVDVTVTTQFATSLTGSTDKYTYAAAPVVTSVSPNAGPVAGGTSVTITGTGFTGATAVRFGSAAATTFSVVSATSIAATAPPGSGTVDVTVTTPGGTSATNSGDQYSYGKAATTLTLTSSPNPSTIGQPVTFTAKVTGNSPTGTVTFSKNGTILGTASLVGGVATFTTTALPIGNNPVTASYAGDANNAADPETVIQVVNGISDSVNLRQMQLATMPVVTNMSGQAISGAIDNAISSGFAGCQLLMPNGSGFTYCFGGDARPQVAAEASQFDGLSLEERTRFEQDFSALGYAGPAVTKAPALPPPPAPWLAWIDLRGTDFQRTTIGNDLKGTQLNGIAGLTYRLAPDFLIGLLGGYEHFDYSSLAYNGVLRGDGWTAGGYLAWQLAPTLRFDVGGAWSDITANDTSGTATGSFTGHRWLASGGLTGTYGWPWLLVEPSARVYALWEQENAYTDSLGTLQPAQTFDTGRASAGVKMSYPIPADIGTFAPYVGIYGDYYFSKDTATINPGVTTVPLLHGGAARATGGLTGIFGGGAQLSIGAEYSGIANNTHIWNLQFRGAVPF